MSDDRGAARRPKDGKGLGAALAADFDLWSALGGVRGLVETTVPSVIFLVVYLATKNVAASVVAPLVVAVIVLVVRVAQRIDVTPALGGAMGIAVSAFWAWRTGEASDYFKLGILTNAAYLGGILVSLAVRWPVMGVLIGAMRGDATGWRSGPNRDDPGQRLTRRCYTLITWIWAGLYGLRLAVQVPLYYAHATEALAIVRLAMGPFGFGLVAWLTWVFVRVLPPPPGRRRNATREVGPHPSSSSRDESSPTSSRTMSRSSSASSA